MFGDPISKHISKHKISTNKLELSLKVWEPAFIHLFHGGPPMRYVNHATMGDDGHVPKRVLKLAEMMGKRYWIEALKRRGRFPQRGNRRSRSGSLPDTFHERCRDHARSPSATLFRTPIQYLLRGENEKTNGIEFPQKNFVDLS